MTDRDDTLEVEELSTERPPNIPDELPILPLRDTVLFPNSFMPLAVARESSVRLIDDRESHQQHHENQEENQETTRKAGSTIKGIPRQ